MFAKLFDSEKYEQILVVLNTNDEGKPSLTISCEPEGLGVCSIGNIFKDTESGWDKAEKALNDFTLEQAEKFASQIADVVA